MVERVILKMNCAKTKSAYELVFEKLAGNSYYHFVRPQKIGLERKRISVFDDPDDDDDQNAGPASDMPDDGAIVVASDGQSELPDEEKKMGTDASEEGINIAKFDFKGCRCPECNTVDSLAPSSDFFMFRRCGQCRQYFCSWGWEERPSGVHFECQCGNSGFLSIGALKSLDQSRQESDLNRLGATVGYLPPPDDR